MTRALFGVLETPAGANSTTDRRCLAAFGRGGWCHDHTVPYPALLCHLRLVITSRVTSTHYPLLQPRKRASKVTLPIRNWVPHASTESLKVTRRWKPGQRPKPSQRVPLKRQPFPGRMGGQDRTHTRRSHFSTPRERPAGGLRESQSYGHVPVAVSLHPSSAAANHC